MIESRRLKQFSISYKYLLGIVRGDFRMVGIAEGAELEWAGPDIQSASLRLIVSHSSFEEVRDGEQIPYFGPLQCEAIEKPLAIKFRQYT